MTKPMIRIYTSDNEFIDREMTDAEFAQYEIDNAKAEAAKVAADAKAQAKAALLAQLGITEEQARLLLS